MKYAIKEIQPNPFRNLDRYPIRRDKVDSLKESLRSTGFWDNIVARLRDGEPEIAYGHHRLIALREEFGPDVEVDLIVRDLDDETMLKIMARENMEEWGSTFLVELETVRAVVQAYADGKIELGKPGATTNRKFVRFAPYFEPGGEAGGPARELRYTAQTVAEFLGWLERRKDQEQNPDEPRNAQDKVTATLDGLWLIEEGILEESTFETLSTSQGQAVVEQARKAKQQRDKAAKIAKDQAERAEREAQKAKEQRERAEAERQKREDQAAKAKDEEKRRQREKEARQAAKEAKEAEERRKIAEQRKRQEQRRERVEKEQGNKDAAAVGKKVSSDLKRGKKGYKQAHESAAEALPSRKKALPDIEDFARKLATRVTKILAVDDALTKELEQVIEHRNRLSDFTRTELSRVLMSLGDRATEYSARVSSNEANEDKSGQPLALEA